MKRTCCLFLTLFLAVILTACGVTKVDVSSVTSGAVPEGRRSSCEVNFSENETRAMSNYMLGNRFVHTGKTLFGSRHDEYGEAYLCRMKFTAGQKGMYVRETEPIERQVDAQYLTLDSGFLYYLREKPDGSTAVARLPLTGGSAPEILYAKECDFLFLRGERLYFTDDAHHLLSAAKDGTDVKTILADKAIYYPYLISDDLLLFQDDADQESLRMRYLPTGFELKVSEGHVFSFILQGSQLYFLRANDGEGEKCRLCRISLNDFLSGFDPAGHPDAAYSFRTEVAENAMGPRFSVNGSHLNASNYSTVQLEQWTELADSVWEEGYTSACQYTADGWEIFYNYNKEGLITDMLFYEPVLRRAGYIEHYVYS